MKKILGYLPYVLLLAGIGYFLGPKPEKPNFEQVLNFNLPTTLPALEQKINLDEAQTEGIKPDNEARIVWADSLKKEKTKIAMVYIHGFSASQEEGNPVHRNIAKKYGANLYLARLAGHGIDMGDATMKNVSADDFIRSAEEALAIGKQLGDEVVVMATSFGGALTSYLASKHPEIKAIVLYSPCIKIYDSNAELLDNPWGFQMGKLVAGKEFNDIDKRSDAHQKYWSLHYHLNAVVSLQNFLTNAMKPETFAKIKCPVFVGYYYKNESEQDKVVSVPAILKMYDELGSTVKEKVAFPAAANHVLASPILSQDVPGVQKATEVFLDKLLAVR